MKFKLKRKPQYYLHRVFLEIKLVFFNAYHLILFKYWGIKLLGKVSTNGFMNILNMNKISIGNNTRFISGYGNYVGGECKTSLQTGEKGEIIIGNNVGISNAILVSQVCIKIDDYVFIGGGTKIYDNDFHSVILNERLNNPTYIPSAPVHIKEGAFIGGHSIILKGVTIGKNAVVGAGSVVTKSIPDNEIWAGAPAKKIKNL